MTTFYVGKVSDIPEGQCKAFEVNGQNIAVFNVGGEYKATEGICRHKGGSLGEGALDGKVITCPLHGWQYDVTTGECVANDAVKKLAVYQVNITDDRIGVDL